MPSAHQPLAGIRPWGSRDRALLVRLVRETPKRSARSRSVSCRIKRMQGVIKSATTGSTSELLRCRGIAHRARTGPPGPPLKPRLEICTERLDPSPSRLRLTVVYAPPAASSINAADACSAGPSGVGLGRHAGTVASARTNSAAPRSGRPSAPALQTRARFRHPLAEK